MTTWALIVNNTVTQVTTIDPTGRYLPSYTWVVCPDNTLELSTYSNGVFTAPVAPPSVTLPSLAEQATIVAARNARVLLVSNAQNALTKSDTTYIRCGKAGVPFPVEWQTYVAALRAIVSGTDTTSTVLPTQPAYPAGT